MEERTDTLAQRLALAREKRGLNQTELATLAGINQTDVSKLERGKAKSTSAIARLAGALRVTPAWLELNKGPMPDWDAVGPPALVITDDDRTATALAELIQYFRELPPIEQAALVQDAHDRASRAIGDRMLAEKFHVPRAPTPERVIGGKVHAPESHESVNYSEGKKTPKARRGRLQRR